MVTQKITTAAAIGTAVTVSCLKSSDFSKPTHHRPDSVGIGMRRHGRSSLGRLMCCLPAESNTCQALELHFVLDRIGCETGDSCSVLHSVSSSLPCCCLSHFLSASFSYLGGVAVQTARYTCPDVAWSPCIDDKPRTYSDLLCETIAAVSGEALGCSGYPVRNHCLTPFLQA